MTYYYKVTSQERDFWTDRESTTVNLFSSNEPVSITAEVLKEFAADAGLKVIEEVAKGSSYIGYGLVCLDSLGRRVPLNRYQVLDIGGEARTSFLEWAFRKFGLQEITCEELN